VSSESYQKLLMSSWEVHFPHDSIVTDDERIATHLILIPARFKWNAIFAQEIKDRALELFPNLTDSEWNTIRENMVKIANDAIVNIYILNKRMDWICALDTFREFEREA